MSNHLKMLHAVVKHVCMMPLVCVRSESYGQAEGWSSLATEMLEVLRRMAVLENTDNAMAKHRDKVQ